MTASTVAAVPLCLVSSFPDAAEVEEALTVGGALIRAGVPLFVARPATDMSGTWVPTGGTGGCGYWLPRGWQESVPDLEVLDQWRPGDALAAVMGHEFDVIDIDPRNGGDKSREVLQPRGFWPSAFGVAATPSGGTHEFIAPLRVGSRDALMPGIDVKGGKSDGSSRGFVFIAPTVKRSKTTDEMVAYRWITPPNLAADRASDTSGAGLAALIGQRPRRSSKRRLGAAPARGQQIPAGERRAAVLSEAGLLRARGVPLEEARATVRLLWETCEQPASDLFSWDEANQVLEDGYQRWPSRRGAAAVGGNATGGAEPDRFFDRNDGLRVASLAQAVNELVGPFAIAPGDVLWVYRDGVYVDDGGEAIRRAVVVLLGERHRASHLTNVMQVLKASHVRVRLPFGYEQPDGTFLNLPNGLLDWQAGALRPHSPDVASVHRLPVPWASDAQCPATLHFLQQLFGDDPEIVAFVEEVVGAVLFGGPPFHQRAVMLLGGGKNGKGTFLQWLRALVGNRNVSEVKPQALDGDRFAAAQLYGKLANLAGDVGPSAFKEAERFKEVTAGDTLTAERKYGQPFSFVPVATVLASFNEMPSTADRSDGFFRRWLVLPFPYRFVDATGFAGGEGERLRDKDALAAVLTPEELSGFLVRAVAGLRRLYDRGDFGPPAAVQAATEDFREHGDPVVAFLREYFTADLSTWLPRSTIRRVYEEYCEVSGAMPLGSARFYKHLPTAATAALGFHLREAKRAGTRGFTGMAAQ